MKALNIALVSTLALTNFACGNAPSNEQAPEAVKVEVENLPSTIIVKVNEKGERTTFQLQDESFNSISEEEFNEFSDEEKDSLVASLTAQSLDIVQDKDSVAEDQIALAQDEIDELQNSKVNFFAYGRGFRYGYYGGIGYGSFGYRTSLYYGGAFGGGYRFGYGYGYGFGYARSAYYIYRPGFNYGFGYGYGYRYGFGGGFGGGFGRVF